MAFWSIIFHNPILMIATIIKEAMGSYPASPEEDSLAFPECATPCSFRRRGAFVIDHYL